MSVLLFVFVYLFFFFKQKTAYEMRISDWSSDVCSSDLKSRALKRMGRRPRDWGRVGQIWQVRLPARLVDDIMPHAEARGCTPNELARRIVEAAIDHDLVAAVLDDGVAAE